ncbi:MAG TPA: pyruvate kinase [Bryobacteraceae bacterium]|nr:pyruvate kinase [Bryobacteraceae bacterium]
MANAKIVVTLGPASDSPEIVTALIHAGTQIFRLNASHGPWEQHQQRIQTIRAAEKATGRPVGILLDLQGPKIRLGKFAAGKCILQTGARFTITTEERLGDENAASTTYKQFAQDVRRGDRVLLNDGAVTLRARSTDGVAVEFDVVSGGPIGDQKGINLPGVRVSAPSLTEKDLADLQAGLAAGVDYVAMSFVRNSSDVRAVREHMGAARVPIIAKIEKPEAVQDIDAILAVANGIMVARGDLGVEMSLEMVPPIQKRLIRRARRRNRFVITATQMLESMIENPNPTRAEVSDVANAIYDGSDAVMLSAETSIGKYPVTAVEYMARIAEEAERGIRRRGFADLPHLAGSSDSDIVADAAFNAARAASVQAIVVFTNSGYSARLVSRYRPPVRIIAMTASMDTVRRLLVNYAVTPVLAPDAMTTDEMLGQMDTLLVQRGLLRPGDKVVFVVGQPVGRAGSTNLMKLHRVAG